MPKGQINVEVAPTSLAPPMDKEVSPSSEAERTEVPPSQETPELSKATVPETETAPKEEAVAEPEGEPPVEGLPEGEAEKPEELETGETVTAAQLNEVYRKYPELKDFLGTHPQLRAPWFRAVEINKVFGTPADAKEAKELAEHMMSFDQHFFGERDGKREVIRQMWEFSKDPQTGQSTGHFEEFAGLIVEDSLDYLARKIPTDRSLAEAAGLTDAQAKVAVQAVAKMLGLRPGGEDFEASETEVKPNAELARLRRREAELTQRERALDQRDRTAFEKTINSDFSGWLSAEIEGTLKKATGLAQVRPKFQALLRKDIADATHQTLRNDSFFSSRLESLVRSEGRTPETASKILAELKSRARNVLPSILRDSLRDAGLEIIATQKEKEARREAAAQRREPVATSSPGRTTGGSRSQPKPATEEGYEKYADRLLGEQE